MNIISLRKRYCNSGEFSSNFMALDSGQVGFIFQYLDPKKYYALELSLNSLKLIKIYGDAETTLVY
jgi:hypothetical protein